MAKPYRELYFQLMRLLSQAVDAWDNGDPFRAREIMVAAMRLGEDAHLEVDIIPEE